LYLLAKEYWIDNRGCSRSAQGVLDKGNVLTRIFTDDADQEQATTALLATAQVGWARTRLAGFFE
jgi:hypothetical protein